MDVEFYEAGTGPGGSDKLLGEWNDTTHVPRDGELVKMPFSMDHPGGHVRRVSEVCWGASGKVANVFVVDPGESPRLSVEELMTSVLKVLAPKAEYPGGGSGVGITEAEWRRHAANCRARRGPPPKYTCNCGVGS